MIDRLFRTIDIFLPLIQIPLVILKIMSFTEKIEKMKSFGRNSCIRRVGKKTEDEEDLINWIFIAERIDFVFPGEGDQGNG